MKERILETCIKVFIIIFLIFLCAFIGDKIYQSILGNPTYCTYEGQTDCSPIRNNQGKWFGGFIGLVIALEAVQPGIVYGNRNNPYGVLDDVDYLRSDIDDEAFKRMIVRRMRK